MGAWDEVDSELARAADAFPHLGLESMDRFAAIRELVKEVDRKRLIVAERGTQIEKLDARLSDEQAKSSAFAERIRQLELELRTARELLVQWNADWRQEPKVRLAFATAQALGAK